MTQLDCVNIVRYIAKMCLPMIDMQHLWVHNSRPHQECTNAGSP